MKVLLVTVYFIGLVNFYKPECTEMREVIVPVASSPVPHQGVSLVTHTATIDVKGLTGGASGCTGLGGQWEQEEPDVCTVAIASSSGATVVLPTSNTPFTAEAGFNAIPRLGTLCPNISGIDRKYFRDRSTYNVRVTINKGTLNACVDDKRWVSYLTTDAGTLLIKYPDPNDDKSATLDLDAVVVIKNMPTSPLHHARRRPSLTGSKAHFWWYYKMYTTAETCTGMPAEPTVTETATYKCPANYPSGIIGASTDVGCSNSNYP